MAEFTEQDIASMMNAPIPGEGLTQNPDNPAPYERPPTYTKLEDFIDELFMNITNKETLGGILDAMRQGVSVDSIAMMLLTNAMAKGLISVDLQLMATEPTLYMLIGLGEMAGVHNISLYPEDDMRDDTDSMIKELMEASKADVKITDIRRPQGISNSLMSKLTEGEV